MALEVGTLQSDYVNYLRLPTQKRRRRSALVHPKLVRCLRCICLVHAN